MRPIHLGGARIWRAKIFGAVYSICKLESETYAFSVHAPAWITCVCLMQISTQIDALAFPRTRCRWFGRSHYERVCSTWVWMLKTATEKKQHTRKRSNYFIEHIRIRTQPFVSVESQAYAIKSTAYCLNYSTCSIFRRNYKICIDSRALNSRLTTTLTTWADFRPQCQCSFWRRAYATYIVRNTNMKTLGLWSGYSLFPFGDASSVLCVV